MSSNGRWHQNIKSWILEQTLIGSSSFLKLKIVLVIINNHYKMLASKDASSLFLDIEWLHLEWGGSKKGIYKHNTVVKYQSKSVVFGYLFLFRQRGRRIFLLTGLQRWFHYTDPTLCYVILIYIYLFNN